ncbi:MAG: hypothetical protein C0519_00855 [Hyphomicrobium sp.]|nr:hypothetical protein [Hyphomicrobium sp.]PPD07967.1 MAG: hypothetical protein CTY28_06700 [Hyphomicrobium sp.]
MEKELARKFAACSAQFEEWFNTMTELTTQLEEQHAKRIRRIMANFFELDEELYRPLMREHPDLFPPKIEED